MKDGIAIREGGRWREVGGYRGGWITGGLAGWHCRNCNKDSIRVGMDGIAILAGSAEVPVSCREVVDCRQIWRCASPPQCVQDGVLG